MALCVHQQRRGGCGVCVNEISSSVYSAGIFKQSTRARNRVGIGLSYRPARLHYTAWQNGSLESILGLYKSLKIRAQYTTVQSL
jgi:hypothetical protein